MMASASPPARPVALIAAGPALHGKVHDSRTSEAGPARARTRGSSSARQVLKRLLFARPSGE